MNIIETNLNFNSLTYNNVPKEIILHHAEANGCTIKDINTWHKNQGWAGIGYHYYVRKDGTIYRGRPENAQGAHCPGHNTTSIGICAEGRYQEDTMPAVQKNAIVELCKDIEKRYEINKIYRHKDLYSTDCPGANYPFAEIVDRVNNVLSKPTNNSINNPINKTNVNVDSWVKELQAECNNQGFSKQMIDGIPGPNTLAGCPLVRYGASGNITKLLQEKLISLGYSCGPCSADGEFGNATRVAVMQFQKDKGLEADGIVGQNTWRKLLGL